MTAYDAYRTAVVLAAEGLGSDQVTHHDMDAASDIAGAGRPQTSDDRHAVRSAIDAIGETR